VCDHVSMVMEEEHEPIRSTRGGPASTGSSYTSYCCVYMFICLYVYMFICLYVYLFTLRSS